MPSPLPTFFSLKSETTNNAYLRYIHQDFGGVHGLLQFSGGEVVSPYTKFHAVEAQGDGNTKTGLVHIQSCYNNKYLTRADQNQGWIVAGADEQQQHPALWSCTLFEIIIIKPSINSKQIKLRHVESDAFLKISRITECLFLSPDKSNKGNVFTVINWNMFVILPKYLAFKGDNGKYICVNENEPTDPYLYFSGTHLTHGTENEVFPAAAGDGSVCIYSTYRQQFWRRNLDRDCVNNIDSWIWDDANDIQNREDARFWPAKVDPNDVVVTLRNLGSNYNCKRLPTQNDVEGRLNAGPNNTPPQQEHLAVEELVKSRTISILNFHALTDARIYNRIIDDKVLATGYAENRTQLKVSKTVWLSYEDTKVSTWNTSTEDLAFTAIIPTTLTSDTPFILDNERIDISGNFNGTYQWGQHHTSSTLIKRRFRVDVPAWSRVTVNLLATEASCDIPFNYSKKDTGTDTVQPIIPHYNEEVGLYTGVSLYNFHLNTQPGPLPAVCSIELI